ncbi:Gfo/Idh/MocA family oxidoreductase [Mesorhizobium sp. KR1-2]|uniref:Gfo/Idh/MocA family protein n=1 Tax=Mesorhizobium sp. KR1-2 TaxID=3156609 RepID=UPI0032B4F84F
MPGVGIIGYGYWGPNLARAVVEVDATALRAIADFSVAALERAGRRHPSARLLTDWRDLIADPAIDAVIIATPVSTHFDIALAALRAGKHVLVEKPMADSVAKASVLVDEAARRSLILMVDHTFIYTGAIRSIHDLIESGKLGDIYYYDSVRVNLGLFQRDVNVIWDLAAHDFAILDFLVKSRPVAISASAAAFLPNSPENMAHLSVYFDNGAMAHLNVNWMAPVKVRQTLIGGSRRMVIYDDMQTSEKVKVYDRGVELGEGGESLRERLISYRIGEMWAPAISGKEALLTEIEQFFHSIENASQPPSGGESGLRVVEMLAAATRSTSLRGQPMELGHLRNVS